MKNKLPWAAMLAILLAQPSPAAAQNWKVTSAPTAKWQGVASSEDGRNLVAAQYMSDAQYSPGWLYISKDSGASWQQANAPRLFWERVTSSSNGTKLAAAAYADASWNPGGVYVSTDAGLSWMATDAPR